MGGDRCAGSTVSGRSMQLNEGQCDGLLGMTVNAGASLGAPLPPPAELGRRAHPALLGAIMVL